MFFPWGFNVTKGRVVALSSALVLSWLSFAYANTGYGAQGTDNDDTLFGTENRDTIHGRDGNDVINGYEDNDTLDGGCGDDTFIFGRNAGHDSVFDASLCHFSDHSEREYNLIKFNYYYSDEVKVERDHDDLLLVVNDENSVRLVNFVNDPFVYEVRFKDSVTLSTSRLLAAAGLSDNFVQPNWETPAKPK